MIINLSERVVKRHRATGLMYRFPAFMGPTIRHKEKNIHTSDIAPQWEDGKHYSSSAPYDNWQSLKFAP